MNRQLSIASRQSAVCPSIPVLAYHQIDTGFELGVNSISPRVFERQMRFIAEQGYTAITPDSLVDALPAYSSSNGVEEVVSAAFSYLPRRPILITFDDGYESFCTYAYPILKQYGLTAAVFVVAGHIGQLNTWDVRLRMKRLRHLSGDQIQTLFRGGIGIGSHGMYHRFLTHCSPADAKAELRRSRSLLENLLQHPIHSFAYPYGSTNTTTAEMVKFAGYRIAFGLNPSHGTNVDSTYCFPRVAIYRCDTFRSFRAKLGLLGKRRFSIECAKNRLINRFAYLNLLWKSENGKFRKSEHRETGR